jgi:hypothetical protein
MSSVTAVTTLTLSGRDVLVSGGGGDFVCV